MAICLTVPEKNIVPISNLENGGVKPRISKNISHTAPAAVWKRRIKW